jgi:CRISPR system Cascade subunit CasE
MTRWIFTRARLASDPSRTQAVAAMLQKAAAADAGHALIWSLFPQADEIRPFLYRENAPGEYLILSRVPPHDDLGLWRLESRDYAPELSAGDKLSFSLRADIQISLPPQGGSGPRQRGARMPLHKAAAQRGVPCETIALDWLSARLVNHGARLLEIAPGAHPAWDTDQPDAPRRVQLQIRLEKRLRLSGGSKTGSLQPVLFDGALEVTNPETFSTLLTTGLGKSRAYGCGLFLIRRQ